MTQTPLEPAPTPSPDGLHGEPGKQSERRRSRKLLYGGIAGAAGLAVVAASIIGIEVANGDHKDASPKKSDKATSEVTPTPTPVETEQPITVESVEIKAGLTPEQLGETFIQRLSDWNMAGATEANYQAWQKTNGVPAGLDYVTKLAEQNGSVYADALFGTDRSGRTDIAQFVPNEIKGNSECILLAFQTHPGNDRRDIEQFKTRSTTDSVSVLSQSGNTITEKIFFTEHNNASKNRATLLSSADFTAERGQEVATVTFTNVNGVERVTNYSVSFVAQ